MKENKKRTLSRSIILIVSALGLILSAYLTYYFYAGQSTLFCTAGSGCDVVGSSAYASILGIPVSLLGVIGYMAIIGVSLISLSTRLKWLWLYFISLSALSFSAYLTFIEIFVIKALCPYCVVSALFAVAIFATLLVFRPGSSFSMSHAKMFTFSVVVIVAVVFGSVLLQSEELSMVDYEPQPDDSRKVLLAKHLTAQGARMYGAYWCPHCTMQKNMFGAAFKFVTNVDCDPKAPKDSNPALCARKNIRQYPTWEINGNIYSGAKSISELEYLSGFKKKYKQFR